MQLKQKQYGRGNSHTQRIPYVLHEPRSSQKTGHSDELFIFSSVRFSDKREPSKVNHKNSC